jgi:hypothetical protein
MATNGSPDIISKSGGKFLKELERSGWFIFFSNVGGQRPLESGTPDAGEAPASEVTDGMAFSGPHCSISRFWRLIVSLYFSWIVTTAAITPKKASNAGMISVVAMTLNTVLSIPKVLIAPGVLRFRLA